MGMYTECYVNVHLRRDTPPQLIRMLELMASTDDADVPEMDALEKQMGARLFTLPRWRCVFLSDSAYFPTDAYRKITRQPDGRVHLESTWNQKNYNGEIEAFWEWIAPWVDCGPKDVVGHDQYEETDEPDLITGAHLDQLFLKQL